ncbi:hypothetical protein DYH09_25710 [bacterium CPR1]|nr:hypothetical protein [bacterium CPR1]
MDFANILFGGPCNRRCPFCIGQQLPLAVRQDNLDRFPPTNLGALIEAVNRLGVRQIVFTGTTTDPQLYRHECRLLELLRSQVTTGASYSLHSNGVLAIKKIEVFNQYDKACLSLPSFESTTYQRMMGANTQVPDLEKILERSRIPVKISCLINEHNASEIDSFLARCQRLGVERVVLRRLLGETRHWEVLEDHHPVRFYRGNPVYDLAGMEVTFWSFDETRSTSLNLFPDGTLTGDYHLTRVGETSTVAAG